MLYTVPLFHSKPKHELKHKTYVISIRLYVSVVFDNDVRSFRVRFSCIYCLLEKPGFFKVL